ncbi:MAG: arylesterase [Bryobacterales bacterium]|nr:arylesterase [Bryobacterales bacterium]
MFVLLGGCTKETPAASEPGPAPPPPVVKKTSDRPVIVAFGDSLSAGFGLEPGQSYPDYLQQILDKQGYSYRVIPEALSGDTSSGGVARLELVLAHQPRIVVLELGANDGLRGIPVSRTRENLSSMIERFKAAGAKVLLASIMLPRNYGAAYTREFDGMYPELARKHGIPLIPFPADVALNPKLMLPDALHPNAEGNVKVAENVFRTLQPLLAR